MFNLSVRSNVKIGLDMADFCVAAKQGNLNVALIRTVDEVESAGSGFLSKSKRPKILFEGHYFYRHLKKLGLASEAQRREPSICYPKWTKQFYIGREGEYARIAKATELCQYFGVSDRYALMSASWGRYQIMGENYAKAGFDSVEQFVEAIFTDEENHLFSFIEYIQNVFLDDELRAQRWAAFASGYNGAGYRRNAYDVKLAQAFKKFNAQKINCAELTKGFQVNQIMPGNRNANPADEGFDNTSLDTRYIEFEPSVQNNPPAPSNPLVVQPNIDLPQNVPTQTAQTISGESTQPSGGGNQEMSPDSPVEIKGTSILTTLDQYGQKATEISTKAQSVSDNVSNVSRSSLMMTIFTKLGGWALMVWGLFKDNWIEILVATVIIVAIIYYFKTSKDRANERTITALKQ